VQPGPGGWAADGSNWGEPYLENFYKTMQKHPDKIAVGGPGQDSMIPPPNGVFNRHMQSACGKTLDQTLNFYQRYYDSSKPLPFLLIETWNDYEEGTAIERRTATEWWRRRGFTVQPTLNKRFKPLFHNRMLGFIIE